MSEEILTDPLPDVKKRVPRKRRAPKLGRKAPVSAWEDFLLRIKKARKELGEPEILWYRGHSDVSWTLLPSLFRYKDGLEKEQMLFRKYKQAAALIMQKRESDWQTLFDMQHYYIPTRLLDWSEVLGVAIFFALMKESSEACIFVLDPVTLNKLATGESEVKRADDSEFNYQSIYWWHKPFAPFKPIAMEPPFQNERMLAQKGMFTIHGDEPTPLEVQCPKCVKKVSLPKEAMIGAREFLEYANINEYSVFPDIVGLAPFLKNIVRLSF